VHNQVKGEFAFVWTGVIKQNQLGRFVSDGMLMTNILADLSCEPDGMFISHESFSSGKVRLVESPNGKLIELEGTPDAVLEVVSDSSVAKDYELLRRLYWLA